MNMEAPSEKVETISAAALEYDGQIYTGVTHGHALDALLEADPDYEASEVRDGFVTSSGRYVERDEALRIAKRNGQTKPNALPDILDANHVDYK